jgi:drug/metabolite transporter (DMT)-like permease
LTRIAAIAGAVIISFSAIFYAFSGVDPTTATFFRAAYSLPALVLIWWVRRDRDTRTARSRWMAVGAGVVLTLDLIAWQVSIGYIGTGLATLLANLQVIVVALVAWALLGEKPTRAVAVAIPIVLIGVAMVSGIGQGDAFGDDPLLGTVFALMAAVFYGGFILALRHSNKVKAPPAGPLMDAMVGSAVSSLLIGLVGPGIELGFVWPAHGWLLALALGAFLAGWLLITYALPRVPASETATIILIQPALTMVWGAVLLSETPSLLQILGALIVLGGVAYVALSEAQVESEAAVLETSGS